MIFGFCLHVARLWVAVDDAEDVVVAVVMGKAVYGGSRLCLGTVLLQPRVQCLEIGVGHDGWDGLGFCMLTAMSESTRYEVYRLLLTRKEVPNVVVVLRPRSIGMEMSKLEALHWC